MILKLNHVILTTSLLVIATHFTFGQKPDPNIPPPNILWIVSEDNSPLLGCYGDGFATTPVLDQMAKEGVLYENAFATAPVCAPARSALITGMYPTTTGTLNMRSTYEIPDFIEMFPKYLRAAGYYTTNNAKTDYNIAYSENLMKEAWDESSDKATYKDRKEGQPFFAVFNLGETHEGKIHTSVDTLIHDPEKVPLPAYHPSTMEMKQDWAQYYDNVTMMDTHVGRILEELKTEGLADNTIVFYYSDHGGVLGRSKRFVYESGLRVPLIIRFPKKYQYLAPDLPGSRTDRLVSFVDFGPTVLSLAGVKVPEYMQGKAFLGFQNQKPKTYTFGVRGRMDETIDMMRSTRDKRYRYISNFMPHKIYGQYLEYLWRAPSMASWQKACETGNCNDTQLEFWKPKPPEELYDVINDPDNVINLAKDPKYKKVLERMRKVTNNFCLETRDTGFFPEAELVARAQQENSTIYDMMQKKSLPMKHIINTAILARTGDLENLRVLMNKMRNKEAVVRYWAVTGCIILKGKSLPAKREILKLLKDESPSVRIAASEALYYLGEIEMGLKTLEKSLSSDHIMVRVEALNVLRLYGKDAKSALDSVKGLLKGKSPKDRSYDLRSARDFIKEVEGA
ncbi:sulfatase-like hydrolase/transferase [Gaetbulibacter sp. M240]|uniref:sulfatase-like hydrolase/transferase n=1 Tax=Gaetbulibacter sp. M240 TaxID=3126511 RepID=UPI00374FAF66